MRRFLAVLPLFLLTACGNEAASIGIIGGADGPTAVFVSGSLWPIFAGGLLLGLIVGILWKKRHK